MDVDRLTKDFRAESAYALLQWSHVLMDVDRRDALAQKWLQVLASMEPRPDGRG